MNRTLRKLTAVAASIFLAVSFAPSLAVARIVGATTTTTVTQPDIACWGGSNQGTSNTATEACLDWNGYWTPTTDNVQKLGTSSLRWLDLEASQLNSGGGNLTFGTSATTLTAAGNQTVGTAGTTNPLGTGALTMPTFFMPTAIEGAATAYGTASGQTFGVFASSTIPPLASYLVIISSGNDIKFTSTPIISTVTTAGGATPIPDGFQLVITSTASQKITFVSQATLSGSGLQLGSSTRIVTSGNILTLRWVKALGFWVEQAFSAGTGN